MNTMLTLLLSVLRRVSFQLEADLVLNWFAKGKTNKKNHLQINLKGK